MEKCNLCHAIMAVNCSIPGCPNSPEGLLREKFWEEQSRKETFENIKARLNSFRCSICKKWLTKPEKRPPTSTCETKMCDCPKGTHNSLIADVDEDDVEWLVKEIERLNNKG